MVPNCGAATGTVTVKDINPNGSSFPMWLAASGGAVYFAAGEGVQGRELWKSNGTSAGTVMVKDINAGTASSAPSNLTPLASPSGTIVFFDADDGTNGNELWRTNGTPAGTSMLKNIYPGGSSSDPQRLQAIGTSVYFVATDGVHGKEVWRSSGTGAGTFMLGDINPGSATSNPSFLSKVGNRLFFWATDGFTGLEPWVYLP